MIAEIEKLSGIPDQVKTAPFNFAWKTITPNDPVHITHLTPSDAALGGGLAIEQQCQPFLRGRKGAIWSWPNLAPARLVAR
ncbi:hypothetical protein [Aliiroseovarius sp.]|uniref:hypothetical protein n=1 Tax=Aliiroseovarius sp. TaxID=1872442 RepID=UPI00261FE5C5|nr:hypothetical protein [Aliiroseovarius sp.]